MLPLLHVFCCFCRLLDNIFYHCLIFQCRTGSLSKVTNESDSQSKSHLTQVGINAELDLKVADASLQGGGKYSSTKSETSTKKLLNISYEHKMYKLSIPDSHGNMTLTVTFRDLVEALPKKYVKEDPANRGAYEDLFVSHGEFVITAAYFGGSLMGSSSYGANAENSDKMLKIMAEFKASFESLMGGVTAGTEGTEAQERFESFFVHYVTLMAENLIIFADGGVTCCGGVFGFFTLFHMFLPLLLRMTLPCIFVFEGTRWSSRRP